MAKTFNLESFLEGFEADNTEKVAEEEIKEETKKEEATETETETETEVEEKTAEVDDEKEKVAELQEEGIIMARSFFKELEKLAVGDGPMTVNTEAIKEPNEVSHLSQGDIKVEQIGKVNAVLNQLQAAMRSGGGDLQYKIMPGGPDPKGTEDETVLPHDVSKKQEEAAAASAMNKAAADKIINNLYTKMFGEEE